LIRCAGPQRIACWHAAIVGNWPPFDAGMATLSRLFQCDAVLAASMRDQAQSGAARACQPQRAAI